MTTGLIRNALTIDVEDYFQVSAFASRIDRDMWERLPGRVERRVEAILGILDQYQVRATFFALGWVADRYPSLIRSIVSCGHELASHGYAHERATLQSRETFLDDVIRAKRVLEDISGAVIKGYRAPSFSIGAQNLWTHDCLREAGYSYSSSVYPIRHDHYGMPDAPRFAFYPGAREDLLEVPVTTVRMLGRNFPAGGGGYFRLLPYGVSRWAIQHVNDHDHQACIFYFHPWEIDTAQPRVGGIGVKTRFRHYLNIARMEQRVRALCADFRWDRVDRVFDVPDTRATAEPREKAWS
jgi:polysaccharide deacetylase family protein (PEP-CTERM system associated)